MTALQFSQCPRFSFTSLRTFTAWLRPLSSKEEDVAAPAVVGEGGDLDGLGVHHHHGLGGHAEPVPVHLRQRLVTRGLETLADVDVSKVCLHKGNNK